MSAHQAQGVYACASCARVVPVGLYELLVGRTESTVWLCDPCAWKHRLVFTPMNGSPTLAPDDRHP